MNLHELSFLAIMYVTTMKLQYKLSADYKVGLNSDKKIIFNIQAETAAQFGTTKGDTTVASRITSGK
jgi:hypothetical protein